MVPDPTDEPSLDAAPVTARRGVLLTVAYDGAPFAGFAPQHGMPTVAGELLAAIRQLDPAVDRLRATSRTDAGVHAHGQRVAFDTAGRVPPRGWVLGLIGKLPAAIAVHRAANVAPGFEPRFAALAKTYRYLLLCERLPEPLLERRSWRVDGLRTPAAQALLESELAAARGTHDFRAFRSSEDQRLHTERTLAETRVVRVGESPLVLGLEVTGDGFLHNMVRILVGTVVDVARGRLAPGAIRRAIASGNRRDGGITAPPDGLYLERVLLRDEGTDGWPDGGECR
jgi:tRNA pseudouridine38-40 synthase